MANAPGTGSFHVWARYQGLGSAFALILGGALQYFYPMTWLMYYGIIVGIIVGIVEYPIYIDKILRELYGMFWLRGIFYLFLSGVCFLQVPLFHGGLFLVCTGITYLVAHFRGDEYAKKKK
eukprot:NODE_1020_length_2597_cov_0.811849.p2 type:complete len:121 gc:universal NODE_1020_length_2597_cov_0.811849:3-365(+)